MEVMIGRHAVNRWCNAREFTITGVKIYLQSLYQSIPIYISKVQSLRSKRSIDNFYVTCVNPS
jgi:hypothetical protein